MGEVAPMEAGGSRIDKGQEAKTEILVQIPEGPATEKSRFTSPRPVPDGTSLTRAKGVDRCIYLLSRQLAALQIEDRAAAEVQN